MDNLWDPHKSINIAKDIEKKEGLFIRSRLESKLDLKMDLVFDKLYDLYERTIIDKARIIFGSNLIEIRYSNNPFCPTAYTLNEFLELELEHKFDFDICAGINKENIHKSLWAMKNLRFKHTEYLEGFRLNSYSGNVWAYFSSSSSLITDYQVFLNYQKLRYARGISHDEALEKLNLYKNYYIGDQEFYQKRQHFKRYESSLDGQIDEFIDLASKMFENNQIFEIQVYLGSGVIRTITPYEPYTTYAFSGLDELKLASQNYPGQALTMDQSLANKDFSRPNLRMNRNLVHQAFQVTKNHRLTDENLYLRVFYIDFMYNKVLTSFSCGGTRYQDTEEYIEDYNKTTEPC
ncbi:MAG: hypothetical protein HQL46_06280 [Gammaproteobacteria bacterium]|nr:hypothetical protein [Gammaproteobacteria bacterium]